MFYPVQRNLCMEENIIPKNNPSSIYKPVKVFNNLANPFNLYNLWQEYLICQKKASMKKELTKKINRILRACVLIVLIRLDCEKMNL